MTQFYELLAVFPAETLPVRRAAEPEFWTNGRDRELAPGQGPKKPAFRAPLSVASVAGSMWKVRILVWKRLLNTDLVAKLSNKRRPPSRGGRFARPLPVSTTGNGAWAVQSGRPLNDLPLVT